MAPFDPTDDEDLRMRTSVMLPNKRPLYEYLLELPLDVLKEYPQKGYRLWMGPKARSSQALALRDYILYWRLTAQTFRQTYPREYLETLPRAALRSFLHTYLPKAPLWVYAEPLKDALRILIYRTE